MHTVIFDLFWGFFATAVMFTAPPAWVCRGSCRYRKAFSAFPPCVMHRAMGRMHVCCCDPIRCCLRGLKQWWGRFLLFNGWPL